MKSASLVAFGAFMTRVTSKDVFMDSTCIKEIDFNFPAKLPKDFIVESDLPKFGLMGLTEKEYSRPSSIKVCFDEQRIYGLQLTLHMVRESFTDEDLLIEKYGKQ